MDPTLTPAVEQPKEKGLEQTVTADALPALDVVEQKEQVITQQVTEVPNGVPEAVVPSVPEVLAEVSPIAVSESVPEPVAEVIQEMPSETIQESAPEPVPEVAREQIPTPEPVVMAAPVIPVAPVKPQKERLEQEIEDILEEDLKDMYLAMSKEKQQEFRTKGELTRIAVRQLVQDAHKNVKKIFQLIRAWLKIIPGVNRYFLEQEAKIKTDKVIFIAEEEKRRGSKL